MKNQTLILIVTLVLLCSISCQQNKLVKYVYDYEKVFSKDQEQKLNDLFKTHDARTGDEVVLVTTADYGKEENIRQYSIGFAVINGFENAENDNWVIIAFSRKNSQVSITPGKSAEKNLTSERTKIIIDSIMIPQFKKENYYEGLWLGSNAVVEFLRKPGK